MTRESELDKMHPYLRAANLTESGFNIGNLNEMYFAPRDEGKYSINVGDLIVVEGGNVGLAHVCGEPEAGLYIQNALHRVRPDTTCNARYLKYFLDHARYKGYIAQVVNRATIPHFTSEKLNTTPLSVPPVQEQVAIANYLDGKTAEIDSLIEQTERSIELLEEYRKSVVSEAVTKGLDPDAPMRDSGIEWIGEIPEHWDVDSLSRSMDVITNGYVGPTRDLFHDSGVRYIQSLHVVEGALDFQKQPYYVSEEWSFRHSRSILQEGDVLVVQTGAIGNVAYVGSEFEGCNCHALIILRSSNGVLGRYLFYCLLSSRGKDAMLMTKTGATHPHLNSTKICRISIPIPPIEDQKSIVDRLDKMEDHVSPIISDKKRAIAALKEYRKSLISEAVTGKFKVPGVE